MLVQYLWLVVSQETEAQRSGLGPLAETVTCLRSRLTFCP